MDNTATKENPAATAIANGDSELHSYEKPYILGSAFATLGLEDTLSLKPKGWYHVEPQADGIKITVHRPGDIPDIVWCYTLGHANQYRLELSDEGMAGLIEGAL